MNYTFNFDDLFYTKLDTHWSFKIRKDKNNLKFQNNLFFNSFTVTPDVESLPELHIQNRKLAYFDSQSSKRFILWEKEMISKDDKWHWTLKSNPRHRNRRIQHIRGVHVLVLQSRKMVLMTMIARVADALPLAASMQEDEQVITGSYGQEGNLKIFFSCYFTFVRWSVMTIFKFSVWVFNESKVSLPTSLP